MYQQTTPNSRKRMISATSIQNQPQTTEVATRSSKRRQINSPFISQHACVICLETGLQLVQLGPCRHAVCRSCMASALLHAFKLQQLPLRCPMPHCKAQLQLQPAVQLMEQQVPGSGALAAKVVLAAAADLALIPHHLRCPCPYSDCQVPLEFPDDPLPDVPLDCPSCQRAVCSVCRSKWHGGLTCSQHQALLCSKDHCGSTKQEQRCQLQQQHQQQLQGLQDTGAAVIRATAAGCPQAWAAAGGFWVSRQHNAGQCMQQQQQQASPHAGDPISSDAMAWSPAKAAGQ